MEVGEPVVLDVDNGCRYQVILGHEIGFNKSLMDRSALEHVGNGQTTLGPSGCDF